MMLKCELKREGKTSRWRIISNVKEIDYEIFKYADAMQRIESFSVNTSTLSTLYSFKEKLSKDKGYNILEIRIERENGKVEFLYTDTSVYIMNDAGKTTELIYP